jgi:hypothetical protein
MRFNYLVVSVQNLEFSYCLMAFDDPIGVDVSVDVSVINEFCRRWAESEGDILGFQAKFVLWKIKDIERNFVEI